MCQELYGECWQHVADRGGTCEHLECDLLLKTVFPEPLKCDCCLLCHTSNTTVCRLNATKSFIEMHRLPAANGEIPKSGQQCYVVSVTDGACRLA